MRVVYSKFLRVPVSGILLFMLAFLLVQPAGTFPGGERKPPKRSSASALACLPTYVNESPIRGKDPHHQSGVNVFGLYNLGFGKSPFGFSIGLGVDIHNIYGNFLVNKSGDTTKLVKIPDFCKLQEK